MDAPFGRALVAAEFATARCVLLDEVAPICRYVGIDKNRRHGAFCLTQTAVDALVGVDHHLIVIFVDAVHRADGHTRLIFDSDTRFRDNVRHILQCFTAFRGAFALTV